MVCVKSNYVGPSPVEMSRGMSQEIIQELHHFMPTKVKGADNIQAVSQRIFLLNTPHMHRQHRLVCFLFQNFILTAAAARQNKLLPSNDDFDFVLRSPVLGWIFFATQQRDRYSIYSTDYVYYKRKQSYKVEILLLN